MRFFHRVLPFFAALVALTVAAFFIFWPWWALLPSHPQSKDVVLIAARVVAWRWRILPLCFAACVRALIARRYSIGIWLVAFLTAACWPLMLVNPFEQNSKPLPSPKFVSTWESEMDGNERVLAITVRGQSRAYPLRVLAYHQIVNDTIDWVAVVATYSPMSHSARVWSRNLGGLILEFHLAGYVNQNPVMQEAKTGSWWQQGIGRAIAGRMQGKRLGLIHSDEMTLRQWKVEQPGGTLLVPDPAFEQLYAKDWTADAASTPAVIGFDDDSGLVSRDIVVGARIKDDPRAFRYEALRKARLVMEALGGSIVLLVTGPDGETVRGWKLPAGTLAFTRLPDEGDGTGPVMTDSDGQRWNFHGCNQDGFCLEPLDLVKEYWFEWRSVNTESTVSGLR